LNIALLLSGGLGSRIGLDIPKQYLEVKGRMIIIFSIETLAASTYIDEIYIVAEKKWRKRILEECDRNGVNINKIAGFADPGDNRQFSIVSGMKQIMKD